MRTSEQIQSEQIQLEIERRFGFFPPFFLPALESPQVLENLWRQTLSAYLENPLSTLFKEKLNALLSRYCAVPYCMVCHSSALRPLGMSAGEVLALLESPAPDAGEAWFDRLPVPTPEEAAAPIPDSPLEQTLLSCATLVFLEEQGTEPSHRELRRLLGLLYPHLIAYLAYIKTCHTWMEAHPDISYDADKRAQESLGPLLAEEPALADFFAHYSERVAQRRLDQTIAAARADERRQSNAALRESEERLRLLVDGARDYAMILMDEAGCITHWNTGAQRILGYDEAEVLGQPSDFIFTPEDRDAEVPRLELDKARAEGKALDIRWHLKKDGGRFWADGVMECLRGDDGSLRGFAKILRDTTERKRNAEALRAANAQTSNILESITDAFFAVDHKWRFTYVNPRGEALLLRSREELLGRDLWTEFPEAVGTLSDVQYRHAVAAQVPVAFEQFYPPLDTWFEVRAYPSPDGLAVYFHDISARRRAEAARDAAAAALRVSEARFRRMADAIPHIAWTTTAEGAIDYYNQRWYDYLGLDFKQARRWEDVIHADDLAPAMEVWRVAFEGGTVSEAEYRLRRADGQFRWHLSRSEPVRDDFGQIIHWVGTATDIEERRQVEDERARLLAEAEARAERESVLNRIGAALRDSMDPDLIQRQAAAALGAALDADRCYFAAYDEMQGSGTVRQEWHRVGLTPLAGVYSFSDYRPLLEALGSGRTLIVDDFQTAPHFAAILPAMERLGLRAVVRVPLLDEGRLVGMVGVAMAGRPRVWTPEEVALVETVAAQTRTAAEAARLRLREHNIATQLQEALKPSLPLSVPGLALKKYHEAAMQEAEVGGDFYDAFLLKEGCTALVVGDLSGKGLAAAAQVATVRNMLRATLYLGASLAEALTNLNDILADNDLLTGFATLFVGVYDSVSGMLTYVNCGQEPGLVRRAGWGEQGQVEELPPTGPVLGTFAGAVFTQRSLLLAPGDALAVFTDGFTEAGPSHQDMLGIGGVTALLAAPNPRGTGGSAEEQAEHLVLSLIGGVDQYAQDGVRDDVCLLVAVVEG